MQCDTLRVPAMGLGVASPDPPMLPPHRYQCIGLREFRNPSVSHFGLRTTTERRLFDPAKCVNPASLTFVWDKSSSRSEESPLRVTMPASVIFVLLMSSTLNNGHL